jgi:hypothetical protein
VVEVWCEWARCWLRATARPDKRALYWQEGPVSPNVEVRLTGGDCGLAGELRDWGYRRITLYGRRKGG